MGCSITAARVECCASSFSFTEMPLFWNKERVSHLILSHPPVVSSSFSLTVATVFMLALSKQPL